MRITAKHLRAKVAILNDMLGYGEAPTYPTPGAFVLYGAYGGWDVHRVTNASGGQESLMGGCGPARECAEYLSAMIGTLRIVGADARSDDRVARSVARRARTLHAARWSR